MDLAMSMAVVPASYCRTFPSGKVMLIMVALLFCYCSLQTGNRLMVENGDRLHFPQWPEQKISSPKRRKIKGFWESG